VAVAVTLGGDPPQILEKKVGRLLLLNWTVTWGSPWREKSIGIGVTVDNVGGAPFTRL
jgi:hypothetical protein